MNQVNLNLNYRLIFSTCLLSFGSLASAQDSILADYQNEIITVNAGETLYAISRRTGVAVADLIKLNQLKNDSLKVDQVLRINPLKLHKIQAKETFYSVSRLYGVTVEELRKTNHLPENAILNIGQLLKIPSAHPIVSAISAAAVPAAQPVVLNNSVQNIQNAVIILAERPQAVIQPVVLQPVSVSTSTPRVAPVTVTVSTPSPHVTQAALTPVVTPVVTPIVVVPSVPTATFFVLNDEVPDVALLPRVTPIKATTPAPVTAPASIAVTTSIIPAPVAPVVFAAPGSPFKGGVVAVSAPVISQLKPLPTSTLKPLTVAAPVALPVTSNPQATNLANGNTKDWQNTALELLGTPYVFGGMNRKGTDCSGLVLQVFGPLGIKLPRVSADQAKVGIPVAYSQLQPGDLVFFDVEQVGKVSHVGIYMGNDIFINANSFQKQVVQEKLMGSKYWQPRYVGARRVLSNYMAAMP